MKAIGIGPWALVVSVALSPLPATPMQHYDDVIDLGQQFQTIDHFTASDCWSMQKIGGWSLPNRQRVADLLFSTEKGIGLSAWRFNLGAGINRVNIGDPWRTAETFETAEGQYDWTRQANERWFLAAAKQRGVRRFIAFACSPPGRMTRSGLTNSGETPGTTNLKPGFEEQFARYLSDILAHFRDNPERSQRIAFDWISPFNEPQWDWKSGQEGNRASNDDIKAVVKALRGELARRGLKTRVLLVESGDIPSMYQPSQGATRKHGAPYGDYVDALCGDPAISDALGKTICYHSYWSDGIPNALVPHREALRRKLDAHPDWSAWQSEYCVMEWKRDLGIDTALRVARVIHCDLAIAGASAWSWWLAVSPNDYKDGLIFTDWHKPGDPETIYPSKLLWAYGNFSRFVRPGMRRVALSGAGHAIQGLMGSAYRDPGSGKLVVVYVNASETPASVSLQVISGGQEVTPKSLTPYVTSAREGDDLKRYPAVKPAGFEVPARAVVTLVGH